MVIARYSMGYHPSKLICMLNVISMPGYGFHDCLIGGQILSAVFNGNLTVVAGITIVTLISWMGPIFGRRRSFISTKDRLASLICCHLHLIRCGRLEDQYLDLVYR